MTLRTSAAQGVPVDIVRARRRQLRRRLRWADALVTVGWASAAVAVGLYLSSGGLASVVDTPTTLTALGIVAGLIGTDFILLMLLLAARLPVIDHTVGQDIALRWHRALGKPALYLLLAHAILLTSAYMATDQTDVVSETIILFTTPDMAIAYLGLGLLVVVVVSSIVAVRRRFPYEVWHAIHLLSYVAVIVALPHQLSAGAVLAEGTVQRWYWIIFYVGVLAAIVWFRFIVPTIRSFRHRLRVNEVEPIAPGVVSIHLDGRDLDRLTTAGGQYAIWRFWSRGVWWHAHPISFSAVPTPSRARVTVRQLGRGSAQLADLKPGTAVSIEGPYGMFTDRARTSPYLAIVAAGIGITPVRTLLEHSALRPGEATVLLRGTDESSSYLWDEMVTLAAASGTRLYSMVGPRPLGQPTWISAEALGRGVTLSSVFPDLADSDLYVCGPTPWTDLVIREARAAGLPDIQIHVERFDW